MAKFEKALALITMTKNTNNNVRGLVGKEELENFFRGFMGEEYDAFYEQALREMCEVVETELFHAVGIEEESEMDWNNPALERYVKDMIFTFSNPYLHSIDNTHKVICQIQHDVVGYIGRNLSDRDFENFLGWYDEIFSVSDVLDHYCQYNLIDKELTEHDAVIVSYCNANKVDKSIFLPTDKICLEDIFDNKGVYLANEICSLSLGRDVTNLTYCIINTSDYDGSMGVTIVQGVTPLILTDYGFDEDECKEIGKLNIGGTHLSNDYGSGVVVVRMS